MKPCKQVVPHYGLKKLMWHRISLRKFPKEYALFALDPNSSFRHVPVPSDFKALGANVHDGLFDEYQAQPHEEATRQRPWKMRDHVGHHEEATDRTYGQRHLGSCTAMDSMQIDYTASVTFTLNWETPPQKKETGRHQEDKKIRRMDQI